MTNMPRSKKMFYAEIVIERAYLLCNNCLLLLYPTYRLDLPHYDFGCIWHARLFSSCQFYNAEIHANICTCRPINYMNFRCQCHLLQQDSVSSTGQ